MTTLVARPGFSHGPNSNSNNNSHVFDATLFLFFTDSCQTESERGSVLCTQCTGKQRHIAFRNWRGEKGRIFIGKQLTFFTLRCRFLTVRKKVLAQHTEAIKNNTKIYSDNWSKAIWQEFDEISGERRNSSFQAGGEATTTAARTTKRCQRMWMISRSDSLCLEKRCLLPSR